MKNMLYKPSVEEIKKDFIEWCSGLLEYRFDVKEDICYDMYGKAGYDFKSVSELIWFKIKCAFETNEEQYQAGAIEALSAVRNAKWREVFIQGDKKEGSYFAYHEDDVAKPLDDLYNQVMERGKIEEI